MKLAGSQEMREIDRRASEEYGIPSVALMQTAGDAFARVLVDECGGSVAGKRIAIVCGRGNNGGDGFVAARNLANAGAEVTVFLAGSADGLKGDAAVFFAPLGVMRIPVIEIAEKTPAPDLSGFAIIGDALLGTGMRGAPTGTAARLIEAINAAGVPVVSCDIPSGVDADTGAVASDAVRAVHTVTFALPKWGLVSFPGAACVGRLTVADIGIPRALLAADALRSELTTAEAIRVLLPERVQGRDTNKGTFGTVLVIAGSAGMVGAAALSAVSALRAGAGLVQLVVPESLLDTAGMMAPEVITKGLPETGERSHGGPGALEAALALAEKADVVALGPGMGRNKETVSFVQKFVQRCSRPLIAACQRMKNLTQ